MTRLFDFWNLILLGVVSLIAIFLLWPLSQVLHLSFLDAQKLPEDSFPPLLP